MAGLDELPDLGIDTTPRGPVSLGPRHRPLVPSSRALAWSRAFWAGVWSLATLAASALAWAVLEAAFRPMAARDVPAVVGVLEGRRVREPPDALDVAERERLDAQAEVDVEAADLVTLPDRRAWATATPEVLALAWARRARSGVYRVRSARVFSFVLVATLVDTESGRTYGLRAELGPEAEDAEVRLTEMRGRP